MRRQLKNDTPGACRASLGKHLKGRSFYHTWYFVHASLAHPAHKNMEVVTFFFFPLREKSNNQTYEDNHFFYFNRIVINYMGLFFIV